MLGKRVSLFLVLSIATYSISQNLVRNPSFEDYNPCPQGPSELNKADFWKDPFNITVDTCSSSDLYNVCAPNIFGFPSVGVPDNILGTEPARTGDGYAGIIIYEGISLFPGDCSSLGGSGWREYVHGQLMSPLVAGETYCVSFWVSLADDVKWSSNNFSVLFTNNELNIDCSGVTSSALRDMGYIPQLDYTGGYITNTSGWAQLQWNYIATGGESYITIGNFEGEGNTNFDCIDANAINPYAYYYIDDVSVEPTTCCNSGILPIDELCLGDAPVFLETETPGGTWSGDITDAATGEFDPNALGEGIFTIYYTIPCGTDSIEISVVPCVNLEICEETNGDFTVSGGTGPYSWQEEGNTSTPITTSAECSDCGYIWTGFNCVDGSFNTMTECSSTGWVTYATGTTTAPPSSYPIQVVDDQGNSIIINNAGEIAPCDNTPCTNLTVTITAESDVSCNGANNGSATVNATGGNGSYTYTWTPGNLNGPTQGGLSPNTYTVNVADSDGCAGSVIVEITEPSAIVAGATPTDASCGSNDGEITLAVSGGAPGYTFNWSNGASTQNVTGLAPGAYSVTITDGNGCTEVVNTTVNALNGPTITLDNSSDASCNGETDGSATVSASGGSGGYTYNWLPGNLTGATQNNLSAGSYDVTVTDSDGCPSTITVVINEPAAIDLVMSSNPSSCTVDDGSATVVASGGASGYNYSWSPAAGATATLSNIGAGSYTVTVTDANGCSEQASVNVSSVNGPIITLDSSTDASCFGETDGSATISVSGGTPVYTYSWSPSGGASTTENNLGAGTYTVTVVDDAGCTTIIDVTIGEPDEIVISGTITDATCADNDGSIQTNVSGGNGGFTYAWTPTGTGAEPTGLSSGVYDVTATDANGCSAQTSFTVGLDNTLLVEVIPDSPIIGIGDEVTLNVVTTPGAVNPNYTWTPSEGLSCTDCSTPIASPSVTTTYTVTVIDENGCTGIASVTVFITEPCGVAMIPTIFSPNNDGNNDELCVLGNCVAEMELSIFNRWGEKVFESTDQTNCWDGTHRDKPVNTGVFIYKLKIINSEGEEIISSGNVTLVR